MVESRAVAEHGSGALFVLGVDTCGPSGSVALARIEGEKAHPLSQKELAGRTYSATLVSAIAEILAEAGLKPAGLGAIVVVSGPGSFTGVRVGLSAVKGLAEPGQIPVVAVSRLEVMAAKAGVEGAALDAHRREVYLRVSEGEGGVRELLAGAEELLKLGDIASPVPKCEGPWAPEILVAGGSIAICEDAVESLSKQVWPGTNLVRTQAPTALDAIEVCTRRVLTRDFADLAKLDGHYLRRSDAEIFGDTAKRA